VAFDWVGDGAKYEVVDDEKASTSIKDIIEKSVWIARSFAILLMY
jgi:hypothetical protein